MLSRGYARFGKRGIVGFAGLIMAVASYSVPALCIPSLIVAEFMLAEK